jgi:hypothetical protein
METYLIVMYHSKRRWENRETAEAFSRRENAEIQVLHESSLYFSK